MNPPRISSDYLFWLHDFVRGQGRDPEAALGPLPDKVLQPFLPMSEWGHKLEAAATLLGDAELGLHFGCTITPQRFGVLGYLLHHCDTLGHAFFRLQQYQPLLFQIQDASLEKVDGNYRLEWALGPKPGYQEEAFALASIFQFVRMLSGEALSPVQVSLMNTPPVNSNALQEFLGCPLLPGQTRTSFTNPPDFLSMPTLRPDAALSALLETQANALLASLPTEDEIAREVRRHIVALLPEDEPTQQRVAERMLLSSRTLHRRLTERELSFRDLLDQTRRELAESYLANSHISLAEVALLLGYAEQSPFTHAFKRWTGMTPLEWRQQHQKKQRPASAKK